jgi:protein disulfide-isomerase
MTTIFNKRAIGLILCLAAPLSRAAELNWFTDLPKAQAEAKAEKKSVLLFFHGSDWCPSCVEMQRDVFGSAEFAEYARQALILVDVDFPEKTKQPGELKRANLALAAKFNVADSYPAVVLLEETGATAFQESGYTGGGPAILMANLKRHAGAPAPLGAALKFTNLDVNEFAKMAADKANVILDVRTVEEYAGGHIAGAVNLDANSPDFAAKAAALDKGKTYLVHCASGVRSVKACDKLASLDFPKLYNLTGGFKAWAKAGKPIEK